MPTFSNHASSRSPVAVTNNRNITVTIETVGLHTYNEVSEDVHCVN